MARVVVIGAGPAGSAAAIHLARLGAEVTLVEARGFPRVKVCGEYVSPAATDALLSLVTPAELRAVGARRVDAFLLCVGARARRWTTPAPAWALSRATLDTLLLDRARAAGVVVRQPEAVRRVDHAESSVRVHLGSGGVIEADLAVHADGRGRHDPAGPTPIDGSVLGRKCHLDIPDGVEGVTMRSAGGAYVGTITVERGRSTVALVVRKDLVARHRGDGDALLAALWPAYDAGWRTGGWTSCPVPRSGYVEPGAARSVRLGNAAGAVDPVGGEGIGLALWSARTFGRSWAARGGLDALEAIKADLGRAYRRRLRVRLPVCRLTASALMRPRLVRAAWPALAVPGLSLGAWYRLSGKPRCVSPATLNA